MSIVVIINPIAGGRPRDVGTEVDLARRLGADCGEDTDVFVTEHSGHAHRLAKLAREQGSRLIVAWGGDGTVNEVASAVAFSDTAVAIIPGGSGNGLARELGIPLDPERALTQAFGASPRAIDVGDVGGRIFVNVAGIGLDAYVASRFNEGGGARRGAAGYLGCVARALIDYSAQDYQITIDGETLRTRALLIAFANSPQYGIGVTIAPAARLDDGALDLVIVEEQSRLASIARVPWLLARALDRVPAWSSRPVTGVTIESDRPLLFHVDGEPVQGGTSVVARVHPGALRICAGSRG